MNLLKAKINICCFIILNEGVKIVYFRILAIMQPQSHKGFDVTTYKYTTFVLFHLFFPFLEHYVTGYRLAPGFKIHFVIPKFQISIQYNHNRGRLCCCYTEKVFLGWEN